MSETHSELENALRSLAPVPSALDRDRLMFQAGQANRAKTGMLWKLSSALLGTAAVVLAALLLLRPPIETRTLVVVVPGPSPKNIPDFRPQDEPPTFTESTPVPDSRLPELAYYRLQRQVDRFGVDALPEMSADPGAPMLEPPVTVKGLGKQSATVPMNLFPW